MRSLLLMVTSSKMTSAVLWSSWPRCERLVTLQVDSASNTMGALNLKGGWMACQQSFGDSPSEQCDLPGVDGPPALQHGGGDAAVGGGERNLPFGPHPLEDEIEDETDGEKKENYT